MATLNLSTQASIAVGEPRTPGPISTCFTEIENFVNTAQVGDDNLTSPNNSVPRTVVQCAGAGVQNGTSAGTYPLLPALFLNNTGHFAAPVWIPDAAFRTDVAVAGKTAQVRLVAAVLVNATAPGVNLTVGLTGINAVAGGSGAMSFTLGSTVLPAVFTTPAAGSGTRTASSWVNLSTLLTGSHCVTVALSGTVAANSVVSISATVEMRHT